jgi:hypothetical protein
MSKASDTFAHSILDAENLLGHFNKLNSNPPPPELEVLKRAGLIMAMTAWETYVEDRILEAASERLRALADGTIAAFVQSKLDEEIKRLHNPNSEKTIQMFRDYAAVDLSASWKWNDLDGKEIRKQLNHFVKLRGEVVHRSRAILPGPPQAHPVTKNELQRLIGFLKNLVKATESALQSTGGKPVTQP